VRRWSREVTERSDTLDLEKDVFKHRSPRRCRIAPPLGRTEQATEGTSFQSAMSMLTFYLNRGGKNLDASRRRVLERAKDELRRLYGRA